MIRDSQALFRFQEFFKVEFLLGFRKSIWALLVLGGLAVLGVNILLSDFHGQSALRDRFEGLTAQQAQLLMQKDSFIKRQEAHESQADAGLVLRLEGDVSGKVYRQFVGISEFSELIFDSVTYTHDVMMTQHDLSYEYRKIFLKSELKLRIQGGFAQVGRYVEYVRQLPFLHRVSVIGMRPLKTRDQVSTELTVHLFFFRD